MTESEGDDLISFLREQFDKAERKARGMRTPKQDAPRHTVTYQLKGNGEREVVVHYDNVHYGNPMSEEKYHEWFTVPAEPDPFLIADLESKRRIISAHRTNVYDRFYGVPRLGKIYYCDTCNIPGDNAGDNWCETLRLLALPYAGSPGYHQKWRL